MFNLPAGRKLLDGQYTINRLLDHGGQGITYLVEDRSKNIFVLKTILEKSKLNETTKKYFYQEASKLSQYKGHHNIVKILRLFTEDIEEVGVNGLPFIVMEYVEGGNLRDIVSCNKKPLKETEALRYIKQIGSALSEVIHSTGNAHRDIKPSNIVIRKRDNQAVLIDFGLTRKFSIHDSKTHTGIRSGGFCAIEQNIPKKYKDIVQKSPFCMDVYSLAATLYFILTKENPPLALERQHEIGQNNKDSLISPKELNPEITDAVNKAIIEGMSIEPEDRPQTVADWLNLLPLKSDSSIDTTITIPSQPPNTPSEVDTDILEPQSGDKNLVPTVREPPKPENNSLKRNIWLGIPALAILGLGTFLVMPKSPSLNAIYESEQHGFSFKYPKSWDEGKIESSLGVASDIVAEFTIPTDNPEEDNAKFIASVEPLNSFNTSLDNYINDIKQQLNDDNANNIVGEVEVVAAPKNNFKQVSYVMEENGQQIERTEFIGIDDGKAYSLTYEANKSFFNKLEKTATQILDSFEYL